MSEAYRKNTRIKNLQRLLDLDSSGDPENELSDELRREIEIEIQLLSD